MFNHKQLEMCGLFIWLLMHQAISIHSVDQVSIKLDQF